VVEDGRPFCPQCRAPQISVRVTIPDDVAVDAARDELSGVPSRGADSDHSDGIAGRTLTGSLATGGERSGSAADSGIAVRSALKAGLLGVIIGIIPFLGILLTGALAVFFYRRKKRSDVPAALGARLGGGAGFVVFAVNALFTIPIIVFHAQQQCVDSVVQVAQKYGIDTAAPQFQASIRSMFTASGLARSFILAVAIASFGGMLAATWFRSGKRRG
jgi:hypothetical protein